MSLSPSLILQTLCDSFSKFWHFFSRNLCIKLGCRGKPASFRLRKKNFFHDAQISLLSRYYTKILFSRISIYDTLLKRNQDLKTLEGHFQFPQDIIIIKYNIVCFKKIVVGIDCLWIITPHKNICKHFEIWDLPSLNFRTQKPLQRK